MEAPELVGFQRCRSAPVAHLYLGNLGGHDLADEASGMGDLQLEHQATRHKSQLPHGPSARANGRGHAQIEVRVVYEPSCLVIDRSQSFA